MIGGRRRLAWSGPTDASPRDSRVKWSTSARHTKAILPITASRRHFSDSHPHNDTMTVSYRDSTVNSNRDVTWEWIYSSEASPRDDESDDSDGGRKRRKVDTTNIIGARLGSFECKIGDCVLLKADGSSDSWVAMICEFVQDDEESDGEMAANFMWFSSEKEIRSKDKKRNDFYWVRNGFLSSSRMTNP